MRLELAAASGETVPAMIEELVAAKSRAARHSRSAAACWIRCSRRGALQAVFVSACWNLGSSKWSNVSSPGARELLVESSSRVEDVQHTVAWSPAGETLSEEFATGRLRQNAPEIEMKALDLQSEAFPPPEVQLRRAFRTSWGAEIRQTSVWCGSRFRTAGTPGFRANCPFVIRLTDTSSRIASQRR